MNNKEAFNVMNLLQNIEDALRDRNGKNDLFVDNTKYIDGVKEAIPQMEKALQDLKNYFNLR